jgi:2-dehydropantoate 2-reductase
MQPLIGPDTTIVSGVNGVPWWYFHKIGGPLEGTRLRSVDPGDVQWNGFGPDRVLGCVVYPAAEVSEPGVIRHIEGNRFSLGEPDGSKSDRATALSQVLQSAGLKAPVRPRLRDELWVKLWGNLSFNPISALTHATLDVLCTDPGTRDVARRMMIEAQAVAEKLGVSFPIDVDRRIEGGAAVGAHRTSMLQDLDAGRPMEIDALVASVQELGRITETPTPTIDTVLALVALRGRVAGLYSGVSRGLAGAVKAARIAAVFPRHACGDHRGGNVLTIFQETLAHHAPIAVDVALNAGQGLSVDQIAHRAGCGCPAALLALGGIQSPDPDGNIQPRQAEGVAIGHPHHNARDHLTLRGGGGRRQCKRADGRQVKPPECGLNSGFETGHGHLGSIPIRALVRFERIDGERGDRKDVGANVTGENPLRRLRRDYPESRRECAAGPRPVARQRFA